MKITLKYPLKLADGKTLSSVELRRAKVRDLKAAARAGTTDEEQEISLLAILANMTPEDVEELDLADYRQLQDDFRAQQDSPAQSVDGGGVSGAPVPLPAV